MTGAGGDSATLQRRKTLPISPVTSLTPSAQDGGKRLDHYLQEQLPAYSRARIQSWIRSGAVLVNGTAAKASMQLHGGEQINVTPESLPPLHASPEDLPVEILYEDDAVIAVNKPAGVVVHAGAGAHSGTLVNRLVHHFSSLSKVGGDLRPGIVHRLDRGTSGVLLVARTDAAHRALAAQFAARTVEKTYLALVQGRVATESGRIDSPITRDPVHRTRMTARLGHGRESHTQFRVRLRLERFTFLEVRIGTGRTHQIRAHLSSIGHPVAGDRLYGARPFPALPDRVFLHAWRIVFSSPAFPPGAERVTVEAPLPAELERLLSADISSTAPASGLL
jgi:23S rRNA pseudouridine1911/1915/1917 synthase